METPGTLKSPCELPKTENNNEFSKIRSALSSIACEIQRFKESSLQSESSSAMSPDCKDKEKVFEELLKCKTKIKSKRNHIQKLRKNLKTACFVAKIVASTKRNEPESLKRHLDTVQNELADLLEKYKNQTHITNSLSRENKILQSKLDNVASFVRLGYEELQKIRNESSHETSTLLQLRHLIECCGEYYARYCNEHDECQRLEQKNIYLTNKIRDLENNAEDLSEQLKLLKYRNFRLLKENVRFKNRYGKPKLCSDVVLAFSELKMKSRDKESLSDIAIESNRNKRHGNTHNKTFSDYGFDLSSHLSLVNRLLCDQDTLLKDLQVISHEFCKDYRSS